MQKLKQFVVTLNDRRISLAHGITFVWFLSVNILGINPQNASAQEATSHLSDREKIDQAVNAINSGRIRYKGEVSSIDSEIGKDYIRQNTETWSATVPITKGDSKANHSWNFYFDSNDRGQILRYSLSNSSWKAAPHHNSWEAADFIDSNKTVFSRRFRLAQTETDKLNVCIDAMNDGFIFIQMPAKALHDFFGQNYNTKKLKTGGKVCYYPLSKKRDCWRLYFFKPNEQVSEYFLTNQPNYFEEKPQHEWWERHAQLQENGLDKSK